MRVKCFGCDSVIEADDVDVVVDEFVAHGRERHTWSYPEDREGLIRDLVHAPSKKNVLITDATHFVLFENKRFEFFDQILSFLRD